MVYNLFRHVWGVLLVCAMFLAGCDKQQPTYVYGVQLSVDGVSIDARGGERRVVVNAFLPDGDVWSVERDGAEQRFECRVEGDAIIVSVEPNNNTAMREGGFNVVSANGSFETRHVTVTQEAAEELMLDINAAECYEVDSEGGHYTFVVDSNAAWHISSSEAWIEASADIEARRATLVIAANEGDAQREATITVEVGEGALYKEASFTVKQYTRAENAYLNLVGKWEITASKWFYSPNGSLNSLDYAPNPSDYYLIFDLGEGEYGKTLIMRDFLYPGTELEVRYDAKTGGIIIPFGWTVLSYDVFFYVTLLNSTQFSYASLEVEAKPNDECTALTLDMPTVDGFNYVGFGLWTYDENGNKVAVGSNYRPTMFPMGDIQLIKKSE